MVTAGSRPPLIDRYGDDESAPTTEFKGHLHWLVPKLLLRVVGGPYIANLAIHARHHNDLFVTNNVVNEFPDSLCFGQTGKGSEKVTVSVPGPPIESDR